ncbi:PREDICTED: sodium/hydrogen exchanger 8-like isoform X2 [Populus euphratica]|uniref:Sodium/hydrogen exchanger 8-like isoform X2 n=1 Tax=Populus euphratica TaxID=75702 RepID=A0AAJ6U2Z3_POPEU|nr:PREDICTED: sodium/hydrogen exchanger 8-like isoform X2 [Populus euphratica]
MGSVTEEEGVLLYRILSSSSSASSDEWNPTDTVIFFGLSLGLGIACRHVLRGTRVPYTVALFVIGIALGSLEYGTSHQLGRIGDGIRLWAHIDPDLLLAVFLPALLFESSFSMDVHQIKRCMAQMLLLAGPGVLISTCCLGCALKLIFPYNWSWTTSLLLGGLLSATDPVAVVALLKELGASKKLSTIIEGESLMNDGTAIGVYQLFYRMVLGESFNWVSILKFLTQVSFGAVGIGVAFGIASVLWLGFIFIDTVIEIALTLAVSYIAYFTAQEGAGVSGVLAVMTLGMFYAAVARTAFKGDGQQSLHHFWEMVAYIANTLIFILSGVVIAEGVLSSGNIFHNHGHAWGYLFLLYIFVLLSRFVVVGVLYPFLRYFGYGLDWKEAIIVIWSGLRGAVALSLSLSVKRTSDSSMYLSSETGTLFVFFTGGIVLLTLIVNGSTTQFILHLLDMDRLSATKKRILNYTKYEMLNRALEAFGDLGDDEELGPVDWPTVKTYIASLNNLDGSFEHPYSASESGNNLDPNNLKDIRIRLLNGVQAAYWGMLDEGRITQTTANILMQSVAEAIDLASHECLCDWKGLRSNVHFPSYYKFLQASIFPQRMITYFTVERLESACYICAAFLRAHRIARRQLHDFIGGNDIASIVINESEAEGEEARKFLEDVRVAFPQVLRVVKTRQVTYSVLNHLIDYVQNLEKVGLLEEKEMLHLHDAVQTDLKRLLRNPPLVKFPKITDLISVHPLLGALPSMVRKALEGSAKEIMKPCGVPLYKEGSKPNGVWLISNGVVKWTSKNIRSRHSLHPTFTHGSTLGLYELLVGKRCMCDIITDSVVLCFFIESEKILSVLGSDPAVEDFLWQESAIVLTKLLLPQVFEEMPMQELRVLVAQRSVITTYIRGETIEVPHHSLGFLLEGFIKAHGFQELIASPAVLLPLQGNQSSQNIEISGSQAASFYHQGSRYQVEARARVIFFDIAAFEVDGALRRRSSSLASVDHPNRPLTREHGGLMSWPENFYRPREHKPNCEGTYRPVNSLSARAMQLSIFGSMVNIRRRAHSFSSSQVKRSHSMSVLRMASFRNRQQVPVPSEGDTDTRMSLEVRDLIGKTPAPQLHSAGTNETHTIDNYSDESDAEDEIVVRIDSPSRLSFHQES